MSEQIIVDIYCRTATENQPGETSILSEQEKTCRDYCTRHGLTVDMVHSEVASGSEYRQREQLQLMRLRIREGKIQGVVVVDFARLSRSKAHLLFLMEEMELHTVELYTASEKL